MARYEITYDPADVRYQISRYLQDIEDGAVTFPDVYELCAERLNVRTDDLVVMAKADEGIARLLNTLIAQMEYHIQRGMRMGVINAQSGQLMLKQPIFGWRDKSVEYIEIKQEHTFDPETRRRIIEEKDPVAILQLRNEVLGRP